MIHGKDHWSEECKVLGYPGKKYPAAWPKKEQRNVDNRNQEVNYTVQKAVNNIIGKIK